MNTYGQKLLLALKTAREKAGSGWNNDLLAQTAQQVIEQIVGEKEAEWDKRRKPKVSEMSDEEWVVSLEGEPALSGVNIRQEIGRAQFWCKQNKRVPTRRFLVNWLNKAERVVSLKAQGASHATGLKLPPPAGPDGWLDWLKTELTLISDEHPAHGTCLYAFNCRQWTALPESWRARCIAQLTASHLSALPNQVSSEQNLRHA